MKHAYLILAHDEFDVLQLLIKAIDDSRNDIFIHFDKKVERIPKLNIQHSNLYIIDKRIDVRWGDVSMVEAEYELFEIAFKKGPFAYYHLLSGVDMPLQSQNDIHNFFEKHRGKEFVGFSEGNVTSHIDRKVKRYHLFPRHFKHGDDVLGLLRRGVRSIALRLQYLLGIRRNINVNFKKGAQWVSITHAFVDYILPQRNAVLRMYTHSFCSDEIFLQTICWNSPFRNHIFDVNDEGMGSMRMIPWKNNKLLNWVEE